MSTISKQSEFYDLADFKIYKQVSFLRLLRKKHPSTYTISKAFAEELVYSYKEKLPIVIVRPSIVISAAQEPEEGFVEGFQVRFSSSSFSFLLTNFNLFV